MRSGHFVFESAVLLWYFCHSRHCTIQINNLLLFVTRPTKVYKYEWVTYELLEWVCITVQPIAAYDWTLFIGQPCSFLTFCIFKICLCVCDWNPLYLFHIFLSANLTPYVCCLHPARTSFFNVPCDLSASERGKQLPVSCQTHTHPTRYWKQIPPWLTQTQIWIHVYHRQLPLSPALCNKYFLWKHRHI